MSKKNLDSIFSIGKETLSTTNRTGATIYKNELFEGLNHKEKKSLRIKLRRRKDAFLSAYAMGKNNADKLNALKKDWNAYAKLVYNDVKIIIDNNATEQNKFDAIAFIDAMGTEKSVPKKRNTTKKIAPKKESEVKTMGTKKDE